MRPSQGTVRMNATRIDMVTKLDTCGYNKKRVATLNSLNCHRSRFTCSLLPTRMYRDETAVPTIPLLIKQVQMTHYVAHQSGPS